MKFLVVVGVLQRNFSEELSNKLLIKSNNKLIVTVSVKVKR